MLERNRHSENTLTSPVAGGRIERINVTIDSLHDWLNAYVLNPVNTIFLRSMTDNTVKEGSLETYKQLVP